MGPSPFFFKRVRSWAGLIPRAFPFDANNWCVMGFDPPPSRYLFSLRAIEVDYLDYNFPSLNTTFGPFGNLFVALQASLCAEQDRRTFVFSKQEFKPLPLRNLSLFLLPFSLIFCLMCTRCSPISFLFFCRGTRRPPLPIVPNFKEISGFLSCPSAGLFPSIRPSVPQFCRLPAALESQGDSTPVSPGRTFFRVPPSL